jgi:hypothetical protein
MAKFAELYDENVLYNRYVSQIILKNLWNYDYIKLIDASLFFIKQLI